MKTTLLKKSALLLAMLLPLFSNAATHGQANRNVADLDSEHQANMANIVNRNQDNASADPTMALPDWFKKITVSGVTDPGMNFGFGNRPFPIAYEPSNPSATSSGGPSQSMGLNAAELYVDAQAADWVLVHTTFAYDTNFNDAKNYLSGRVYQPQALFVEEASVTLANFEKSPFWLTAGRQFLPFGSYKHNTISKPLTQFLSEANNVALTVGGIQAVGDMNLYGDVYAYQGIWQNTPVATQNIQDMGANIGINKNTDALSYNFNLGFINNMINAYFVGNACNPLHGAGSSCAPGYLTATPALSAHFDATTGPFGLNVDYVTALSAFSSVDLPSGANPVAATSPGAKPWAYALETTFNFPSLIKHTSYPSRAFLGFQQSGDAVNISSATVLGGYWMPQYRYTLGYGIDIIKNLSVRVQYQYDVDYATSAGGTGLNNNTVLTDLKVFF